MGRPSPHLLALLCGLALAALVAAGCGGNGANLIPQARAQDLENQLDALQSQIQAGRCGTALAARVRTFHDDATNLPKTVDKRLRTRINEGVTSLRDHAQDTCQEIATEIAAKQQEQQDTQTQTTDTTTTQTDTTTTETTPTTSTPTTSTPSSGTPSSTTPPDTGGGTAGPSDTTPGDSGSGSGGGDTGGSPGDGSTP